MFTCAKVLHRTSCVTLCIAYATHDGLVSSIISALQSKKGFYMNASMHCHRSECKVKQLLKNSWVSMTVKERWRRPWSKRTSRSATWGSVEFENLDVQSLRFSEAEPVTEKLHLRQCITASAHTADFFFFRLKEDWSDLCFSFHVNNWRFSQSASVFINVLIQEANQKQGIQTQQDASVRAQMIWNFGRPNELDFILIIYKNASPDQCIFK